MASLTQEPQAGFVFPEHVPQELRWDHSLGAFAHHGDDPFAAVSRLHEGPDIFFARDASQENPAWVLTRHALIAEAFVDWEHFSSKDGSGVGQMVGGGFGLIPIDTDPPEQVGWRRIINPFFTPKAVNALEASVSETCERLIAGFAGKRECEFIGEFAVPFPTYVFLSLMGMPLDQAPQFLAWEQAMLRGKTPEERGAAGMGVMMYLKNFIDQQRARPTSKLIDGVINSRFDGEPLSDGQLLGIFFTFYVGGLDTVYSTIGWSMRHLAMNPELQGRLRSEPELVDKAVDEFVRAFSVVSTKRKVRQDFTFHGVTMKAGDTVLLPLFLAGRDPQEWDQPDMIDLDRRPASVGFGSGPHLCAGRQLARREMRIAIKAMLAHFSDIRLTPGKPFGYHTSPVYGIDTLHLTLDPA